ncbi:accessory protein [Meliandou mastomys virus]|uniref:Accessory protein n=1 Tax=Meliandou mastomys virus TaxID=2940987 RepID=A0AAE9HQC3_9MONO|nr:accessory protein [Meliandou mastomys virus]
MEWRLSSLYSRIRRTFRRPMAEVPLKSQVQKKEQLHGKNLQKTKILEVKWAPGDWEATKEVRKRVASRMLRILDKIEEEELQKGQTMAAIHPEKLSSLSILQTILTIVRETGQIPDMRRLMMPNQDVVSQEELKTILEVIQHLTSLLPTTIRS